MTMDFRIEELTCQKCGGGIRYVHEIRDEDAPPQDDSRFHHHCGHTLWLVVRGRERFVMQEQVAP